MKVKLIIILLLVSSFCFGQVSSDSEFLKAGQAELNQITQLSNANKMQVKQSDIKIDEAWQVTKNNLDQIQNYLNQQISVAKMDGQIKRAERLITLKKDLYSSLRDFRNASVETIETTVTVDSLQTVNQIKKLTIDINTLKDLKTSCFDCDTLTIGQKLFELKNEKNKLVGYTKNWKK